MAATSLPESLGDDSAQRGVLPKRERDAMARRVYREVQENDNGFAFESRGAKGVDSLVIAVKFASGNIDIYDCIVIRRREEEPS